MVYGNITMLLSNHNGGQIITPFLIILRVADRTILTNEAITSGNIGSIHFKSREKSTDDNATLPDGDLVNSVNMDGENLGVEVGTIEAVPL